LFIKSPLALGLIAAAAIVTITSCATPVEEVDYLTPETSMQAATADGVPGGIIQETASLTATVKAIDYKTRKVTLVDQEGNQKTLEIGPDAVNFDQVEKGDVVRIEMIDEMAIYLQESGTAAAAAAAEFGALADEGDKPAGLIGEVIEIQATILAVDLEAHTATLGFEDGTERTVPVRPDVKLAESQVGKVVVMRSTTAVALEVTKVTDAKK
jgi:Cu/Ag efflux protein CusF